MYILASHSPRRKWLMERDISPLFKVVVSNADEHFPHELTDPKDIVKFIAKEKGEIVAKDYPNDIVISADTIVVLDNEIIGKPVDAEDAKRILRKLSNREHEVITAYCLFKDGKMIENHVISKVLFYPLSDELIDKYVATGSPLDKAGAYGVQDNEEFPIVKAIIGSVDNVIGFPVKEIEEDLNKIN